jgi:hypothetical protein
VVTRGFFALARSEASATMRALQSVPNQLQEIKNNLTHIAEGAHASSGVKHGPLTSGVFPHGR